MSFQPDIITYGAAISACEERNESHWLICFFCFGLWLWTIGPMAWHTTWGFATTAWRYMAVGATQAIRIQSEDGPHLDTFRLDPCPHHYIAMWMYWMYWAFWLHNLTISVCYVVSIFLHLLCMFIYIYKYKYIYCFLCLCIYYLQPCIKTFQFLNYWWMTIFGTAMLDFARLSRGVQRGCSHCQHLEATNYKYIISLVAWVMIRKRGPKEWECALLLFCQAIDSQVHCIVLASNLLMSFHVVSRL